MPNAAFFKRLGIFALQGFLDAKTCAAIQAEMRLSQSISPATVVSQDDTERVDEEVRKTEWVTVAKATKTIIKEQLIAIQPQLEAHFSIDLDPCEGPQFLAYKKGDFFNLHNDNSVFQQRRVTVVLFLNGESPDPSPDDYAGGSLVLYGLIKDSKWESYGFNIQGEPGLLIAFTSDIYHEVTPVTQGMRCTIVTWFSAKTATD
jgi:predicted 2-oxoglutarate/Fe(II)-dependent dioxygenase YbiX